MTIPNCMMILNRDPRPEDSQLNKYLLALILISGRKVLPTEANPEPWMPPGNPCLKQPGKQNRLANTTRAHLI